MSNPYDTASERMSVLPPSLKFKGELSADEDLLIQGTIEGTIHHTQRVTICEEGQVRANIDAQVVKIEGKVEGDVRAERSVFVAESGNLRGNIQAPSVCLVEGSNFNGSIDMDAKKKAVQPKPDAKAKSGTAG